MRSGVEQLANQISKAAPEGRQPLRVAVADFPDLQGVTSDLGRFVASRLTTRLSQDTKFFVIERQRLTQVLAELRFGLSDLVDPAKAKQLGKMTGVEAIVVGSIADLGNQVDIDARLIDIETTRTMFGASATLSKDQVVSQMIERGRQDTVPRTSHTRAGPGADATTSPAPGVHRQRFNDFIFEVRGCRVSGAGTTCQLMVTNTGAKESETRITPDRALLYDDQGNNYRGRRVKFGNEDSHWYVQQLLFPGIPLSATLLFDAVPTAARRVTLGVGCEGSRCSMTFRDIGVEK